MSARSRGKPMPDRDLKPDHITHTAHADGTVTASCRCGAFTSGPPEYVGEGLFRVKHKDCAPREAARRKR